MLPKFQINTDPTIVIERITATDYCVIVDDFLQDPHSIVEFAIKNASAFSIPADSYPGLLFDVNDDAMANVYRFIRSAMSKTFGFFKGDFRTSTYLSMATMQPDELSNLQRLCHSDPRERPDRRNYAGLVYLFEDEALGGTGFFRWKEQKLVEEATALELQDPERALRFLQDHFPTYSEPASYMAESNEIAELLTTVPAMFNRFIFYSGDVPHGAMIKSPELLSKDFAKGRLTLNCFASVKPR